jgi:hypothetical protein
MPGPRWTELPVVLDSSGSPPSLALYPPSLPARGGSFAPPGTITTSRDDSSNGWLICNGQEVSRSQFNALFVAIGTLHGAGDGSTI